jgi:hypothetical protein
MFLKLLLFAINISFLNESCYKILGDMTYRYRPLGRKAG